MKKLKYAIFDNSFILRQGIISLMTSHQNTSLIKEACIKQLNKKNDVITEKIDILFVNCEELEEDQLLVLNLFLSKGKGKIIGLYKKEVPEIIKGKISDYISYFDSKQNILQRINSLTKDKDEKKNDETYLSDRERTILRHIALGQTNNEIADALCISSHTVMTHRKNLTKKLGIKTVSGLVVYALLNDIVSMDEVK